MTRKRPLVNLRNSDLLSRQTSGDSQFADCFGSFEEGREEIKHDDVIFQTADDKEVGNNESLILKDRKASDELN